MAKDIKILPRKIAEVFGGDREVDRFFREVGTKVVAGDVSIDELFALLSNYGITETDDRIESLQREAYRIKEDMAGKLEAMDRRLQLYYSEIETLKQDIEDLKRSV